ncbi:MAG: nucleotide exchange factor GrpE [Lachnospiraceae bacterium]|nr:nucleotide exchange factor GrpE [Lachnospiraceae bacterium]
MIEIEEVKAPEETEEVPEETTPETAETPEAPEEPAAPEPEGSAPEEEPAAPAKEKKGFFGKGKADKADKALKEAEAKLDEAEARLDEAKDRIQRQMAEFDNYRKRTEKEKAASFDLGARSVIEKLLPVVDSFERGLATLDEAQKEEPFETGMVQVYRQLGKILEDLDVKPIEAVGQPFNADLHNAVMHAEDEDQPENTVVQEFQKGYTFRGTVIRYSMVKVVN